MTPVTVAAGSVAGGSGNTGWSAKALFVEPASTSIQHRTKNLTQAVSGGTGLNSAVAQSFTAGVSTSVLSVSIRMYRTGTPTDDLYVTINTNATDRPSATVLGTSANVSAASLSTDTGNGSWITFTFSSPVAITGGTKYWFVVERTGARDTTNYGRCFYTSSGQYASHGLTTRSTSTWSGESGSNDMAFAVTFSLAASRLFVVAQDTSGSPKQHVYASADDGATWTELDAANAPTVTDGTYPFSANLTSGSNVLTAARFSATNTVRARVFNVHDDTWDSTDLSNSDVSTIADNISPIRVLGDIALSYVLYTSLNDTADIAFTRTDGGSWSGVTVLSVTSAERSIIADAVSDAGFHQNIFYDAAADDFTVRSLVHGTATQGTALDIDATVATTEAGHTPAAYEPYLVSGVTRVTAAYIDSNNTINERTASLDVTSASVTFGTQRQVTTSTAYAGGKLSTCAYDGDRYCFASNAAGTSIDYWISSDDTTSNTWSSGGNVASGSGLHLSQALPVDGVGIIVLYQSGSNVVVDWAVDGPGGGAVDGEATTSTGPVEVVGRSVTATATANVTAATSTGAIVVQGQTATATGAVSATATTATAAIEVVGRSVTASGVANVSATTSTAPIEVAGQSATATGQRNETATTATAALELIGQSVTATGAISATATTAPAVIEVSGNTATATGQRNETAVTATAGIIVVGQTTTVSGTAVASADTLPAAIAVQGHQVQATYTANVTATTATAGIVVTGNTTTVTGDQSAIATTAPAAIEVHGQQVSAAYTANVTATTSPARVNVIGRSVNATGSAQAIAITAPALVRIDGQPVSVSAGITIDTTTGAISLTGHPVQAGPDAIKIGGLTGRIEILPALSATMQIEPALTGVISIEPTLSARLEVA